MTSSTDPLNRIYAEEMRHYPYGYALYQPASTAVIKPGIVGYFDSTGFWSPLADLNDTTALKAAGLTPPKHPLSPAPPQDQTWGPMTSKSVTGHDLKASPSLGPAATGLPLSASVQIKYTSSSSFGAVLVTNPPVTHSAFYFQSIFSSWVSENAGALLSGEHKDDIHANGLVVVTQTYSTDKCALTAWTEGKGEAFLAFDAEVPGVGKADPNFSWHEGNSISGWMGYEGSSPDKMVVFLGGLWFDCRKEGFGTLFRSTMSDETQQDAGSRADSIVVTNRHGETYHLDGKVLGAPLASEAQ
ncbi:MAG: hypothetical protein M1818_003160 [Claussenomyces sp. TS43310]|nr:MAG: hypothetical protein M1818_003160 [Claussenomyces sp. TS43310]